ncbi:hypothetical protein LIER_27669 [Lithospermum erythrorhizon]|uniref:Helitron helicase-like domain-containing protein n=1 Tax=Lithospermum erythrorhizon TaxID=34254 RepID=A0AAV3RGF3_LITER
MTTLPRLDRSIVERLVELMEPNPYAEFLKHASTFDNIDQYDIVIRADPGLDQRTYNKPTCTEVVGIWIEDQSGMPNNSELWDIRVYTKSGRSHRVQYYYGCYDPLQYVLRFPNGEPGWHCNIARVGCSIPKKRKSFQNDAANSGSFETMLAREQEGFRGLGIDDLQSEYDEIPSNANQRRKRKTVSCREYYLYKLQDHVNDKSYILRFGRLFQQYIVDNYIKIETMRLDFLRNNQKKLRRERYQGVVDSVISGILVGGKVGTRVYLPPTFVGGPRDSRHQYLDSMALVQEFGRPDLFLTMTCNPNWPEIMERLKPGEEAQNSPNLLARVFKEKLSILNDKIMSEEIFGKIASVVHVVEFQKRGLPHAHFLIILKPQYKYMTPDAYDRIVCSELPDNLIYTVWW